MIPSRLVVSQFAVALLAQYTESGFAPLIKLEGPTSPVQCMTTVEGGESSAGLLISAHRGGTIHMWDLSSGAPTTGTDGSAQEAESHAVSSTRKSPRTSLRARTEVTECPLPSANPPPSAINTGHTNALCAIWLEESYLFTAALDGHVKVWDGNGGQLWDHIITNQQNEPSGVAALLVVPEGESNVMVTACDDKGTVIHSPQTD